MTRSSLSLLSLGLCLSLCACASSKPKDINYEMTCEEISAELEQTRAALYEEKSKNGGNGAQVADTAASVGVIGAGMAGVPYVGGIYTIGKTLLNHRKYSAVSKKDALTLYMDELEYLAQRKLCTF